MTTTLRAGLLGTAIGLCTAAGAWAQDVTLRLHQFLPEQAAVPRDVLIPWMERITEASDGRIAFEHYPAMQLGGRPPELFDQAADGVADVVWTLPGYTPGRFPRSEVFELPFMVRDAESASAALWQMYEDGAFGDEFDRVKVLGLWVHGPGVVHSAEPVVDVTDMQGLDLRTPTRVTGQLITELGGNAVGMPVPQVAESLTRGVIDGAIIPWEVTGAIRSSELVSNHTEFPDEALYVATFLLAMNQSVYDSLPDDLKTVIDENSGAAFSEQAGAATQAADKAPRQAAMDMGNNIITLTSEQAQEWKDSAHPVIDAWIAEADAAGLDGQALVDGARAAIESASN